MFESLLRDSHYLWCLHCETVDLRENWVKNDAECPTCNAGALDAWVWSSIAVENGYPKEPKPGTVYPMYPE